MAYEFLVDIDCGCMTQITFRGKGSWPRTTCTGQNSYPFVLSIRASHSILSLGQILLIHGTADQVYLGSHQLTARRDHCRPFRSRRPWPPRSSVDCFQRKTRHSRRTWYVPFYPPGYVTPTLIKNGFHELHNEPNGVKEKLVQECIAWVEAHLSSGHASKL